jgi:hypothetical protein
LGDLSGGLNCFADLLGRQPTALPAFKDHYRVQFVISTTDLFYSLLLHFRAAFPAECR